MISGADINSDDKSSLQSNKKLDASQTTNRPRRRVRINSNHRLSRLSIIISKNRKSSLDLKPFKCPVQDCKYAGKKTNYLKIHMKVHSKEMKQLIACENCPKLFRDEKVFNDHVRLHEAYSRTSENEKKSTESKKLEDKSKDNYYTCNICEKQFKLRKWLEKHIAVHKNKSKS